MPSLEESITGGRYGWPERIDPPGKWSLVVIKKGDRWSWWLVNPDGFLIESSPSQYHTQGDAIGSAGIAYPDLEVISQ